MKSYQYILLDWDGNLANTLDIWMEATRQPLAKRGIHISDNQIAMQCFGRPHEGYKELGITDVEDAIEEMDSYARKLMPEVELYPDTPYVLEELRNMGKRTALITSSSKRNVFPVLDKYNMHHYFDVIITRDDTEKHKPHPAPLYKAIELLGAKKEDCVMIGDSDKDIGAAKNAGVDSILFHPENHKRFYTIEDMKKLGSTYLIEDFREVISIVN